MLSVSHFLLLCVPKLLIVIIYLAPLNLARLVAQLYEVINLMVHFPELVPVLNRRLDFPYVHPILFVSHGEGHKYVLFFGKRVDRLFLGLPQGHETIVRAIQCLVPSLIPCELVYKVGVYIELVLLKDFHAALILQLVFVGGVHL